MLLNFIIFCLVQLQSNYLLITFIKQMIIEKSFTLPRQLSFKTLPCGIKQENLNEQVQAYFVGTFQLYEKLFQTIKESKSYYKKPQPLRHPLIFYYGHTAAFYMNKLREKGLIKVNINQYYDKIFAVGIDQMDWDDIDETHYQWPSVSQTKQYREKIKEIVVQFIRTSNENVINENTNWWIILMGIQHERIHLQTSAVIIRRLPVQELITPKWLVQCQFKRTNLSQVPKNIMIQVPGCKSDLNRKNQKTDTFGWDNEFGNKIISIKSFKASKMLVSNAQYLQFIKDKGYQQMVFWTQQGKNWLNSTKKKYPIFWIVDTFYKNQSLNPQEYNFFLKTITNKIQMPWDWPVEVNNLEAQAFCKWKSIKTQSKIRLPTEDQYLALRNLIPQDLNTWQYQSVGNINLEYWFSPNPVDTFKKSEFFDIVGNVWQHTITPLYPFDGFKIHPSYQDFSTPAFDNRHNVIKGGSFISTGNEAIKHTRQNFRRHIYQFSGFRYVESQNQTQIKSSIMDQSDQIVLNALKNNFINKNSYIQEVLEIIKKDFSKNDKIALTVGCSVGRILLQLLKIFKTSYGIDYTARYFQMTARLLSDYQLRYKNLQIHLDRFNIQKPINNIFLYQMNPENTDYNKINDFSFILIDGLSIKQNTIMKVFQNIICLIYPKENCEIIIVEAQKYNKIDEKIKIQGVYEIKAIEMRGECLGKTKEETGPLKCKIFRANLTKRQKRY